MKTKLLVTTIAALSLSGAALFAQTGGGVSYNTGRLEAGITVGQTGSFTDRARFGMGAYALYSGFYLDFIKAEPQHRLYGELTDEQWHDNSAFGIHAGYQIPVAKWLRIMPLLGYDQTNEGITDGTSLKYSPEEDGGGTWYHDYKVTPGSRRHYFNFGAGLSIQPCKWFSVNLIASRYALYAGIGVDLISVAGH